MPAADYDAAVELTDLNNMQKSNTVLPREWIEDPQTDTRQPGKEQKKKGISTDLYWFTGVPEHMKLSRGATKQQLRQCKRRLLSMFSGFHSDSSILLI